MTTRQTIKKFMEPAYENKGFLGLLVFKSFSQCIIVWSEIEFTRRTIVSIEQGNAQSLKFNIMILIGITIANLIRNFTLMKYGRASRYYFAISIYKKIIPQVLIIDNNIFEQKGTGRAMSITAEGINARGTIIDRMFDEGPSLIFYIIAALYYVYEFGGGLSSMIIALGGIILFIYISYFFDKKVRGLRKQRGILMTENSRHRVKILMHKGDILRSGTGDHEITFITDTYEKIKQITLKLSKYAALSGSHTSIRNFLEIGIYFVIGFQIINGSAGFATISILTIVLSRVFSQINRVVILYQELTDNHQKIQDMFELIDSPKILGYDTGSIYEPRSGSIIIKNLDYGYQSEGLIFSDFSLSIAGGSRIALVGPSGGGKSTLIKLIAGYLHPKSGEIVIDGQSLPTPQNISGGDHISLQSYYPHLGYLTQEPSVFDGTIYENLIYGLDLSKKISQEQEKAKTDKNIRAPRDTNLDNKLSEKINIIIRLSRCEFVYDFKDGLNTEIGEKGIKLSGGQRQRLAIAKIMLKNPSIILLDEPTSALDSENEELVTQALNELFKGKTVIVIAHRLQTVKHADQILYIDNGHIIESGTHHELYALAGKYHKMVELQSGF